MGYYAVNKSNKSKIKSSWNQWQSITNEWSKQWWEI